MLPTFNVSGDVVLVDKLFWKFKPLELGSILVYISPQNPDRYVIKRLLGKPGDMVYIDPTVSNKMIKVPAGHVWTTGDNYPLSNDSRIYGPVPMGLIQGQLVAQIWPELKWIGNGFESLE